MGIWSASIESARQKTVEPTTTSGCVSELESLSMKSLRQVVLLKMITLTVLLQVLSEPNIILDQQTLDCAAKLNVDKYLIDNNVDENYRLPKGQKEVAKYIHCIMESYGMMQGNGQIEIDNMYKAVANVLLPMLGKEGDRNAISIKISDECVNSIGDDLYDRVINIHNCLVDAAKKF
ncbi:hypothetical protein FQR65_LT07256 [Abscondita terminalis]|nr:hypothetical protein FQR65_LT07256 [Abscondita terminalis]